MGDHGDPQTMEFLEKNKVILQIRGWIWWMSQSSKSSTPQCRLHGMAVAQNWIVMILEIWLKSGFKPISLASVQLPSLFVHFCCYPNKLKAFREKTCGEPTIPWRSAGAFLPPILLSFRQQGIQFLHGHLLAVQGPLKAMGSSERMGYTQIDCHQKVPKNGERNLNHGIFSDSWPKCQINPSGIPKYKAGTVELFVASEMTQKAK